MFWKKGRLWTILAILAILSGFLADIFLPLGKIGLKLFRPSWNLTIKPSAVALVYATQFTCDFVDADMDRNVGDFDDDYPHLARLPAWVSPHAAFSEQCLKIKIEIAEKEGWADALQEDALRITIENGQLTVSLDSKVLLTRNAQRGDDRAWEMHSTYLRLSYPTNALHYGISYLHC